MKNGADCDEPICVKTDPLGSYKRYMNKGSRISFDDIADDEPSQKKTEKVNNTPDEYRACPNTRESLGFFTWNFLHTMSVYYPENPTEEQKTKMRQFVAGLAEFYPCKMCAAHLKKDIEKNPPRVDSNKELAMWFCEQHNTVNKWLQKPEFDCSWENLLKRYKTGYDHCKDGNGLH